MASSGPTRPRLAIAIAACAAGAWFVHLAASYALVPSACRWQSALPLLVVTVAGVAVGVGCAVVAARAGGPRGPWTHRMRASLELGEAGDDGGTDVPRIAMSGLALATYFTFVMLLAALIPIVVDPCA